MPATMKPMPTLMVGEPYIPPQPPNPMLPIDEPVAGIGMITGRHHFTVGDNPNGETMTVTPNPPRATMRGPWDDTDPTRVRTDDNNGAALLPNYVPGTDYTHQDGYPDKPPLVPFDPAAYRDSGPYIMPRGGPVSMAGGGSAVFSPQEYDWRQKYNQAQQNIYGLSRARIPARQAVYDASSAELDAQGARLPYKGAVIQANRGFNDLSMQQNAQRRAEETGIQAAQADVGDQVRTASMQSAQNNTDYRYGLGGLSKPIDIEMPTGSTQQLTDPRVRAKIMTRAEQLSRDAKNAEAFRTLDSADAKGRVTSANLAYDESGMPVEEAQQAKARASLNYDQSGQALDAAQLDAQEARFNEGVAGEAPGPGLVRYTMPDGLVRFVSPGEADQLDFQHGLTRSQNEYPARYAQQQQQNQYRTGQEAQGGSPQYTALTPPQLLNTLPNNATIWQTQPIVMELVRRYKLKGYSEEEAAKAAFALIQQEMDTRKKTSTTLFGATPTPSTPGTPQTPASGAQPFTFKTP